ncbi:MAG: 2-C-methyl-D-erythritol 2,4-cyclodiphosphate synthase [Nitrospinae bacterium]|nr:2-C-methyl-D-erythritol 2,4-cyclodiphosphate synthase [Nitrospinota bacterium]MBF0633846.1 2-C-methyl-D-erythritol 2,4-cyclodiphosphate synthase [Nitrospinota bacterium]
MYRVGHGFDAHRLVEDRRLVLGGVDIPFEKGLLGHSDADVLIHAICDALLGATAMGDIGRMFPDTDERYRGISSLVLLEHVAKEISSAGYRVSNIDTTVAAQAPRLAPHAELMRENLAKALGVNISQVSVKATTTEKMGFTGRGDGIAAWAVAMVEK